MGALDEVLVGRVGLGGGADVQDAVQLGLGVGFGVAADDVAGDAEAHRGLAGGPAGGQGGDLGGGHLGRVAGHHVGVAVAGGDLLGPWGVAAPVDGRQGRV